MTRSKPAILKRRIVLTEEELSVDLEPAVVHRANEVDMNANVVSVATHPGLHSYLVSASLHTVATFPAIYDIYQKLLQSKFPDLFMK